MRTRQPSLLGLSLEDIEAAIDLDRGSPELRTEFLLNAARRIRREIDALGGAFPAEPPVPEPDPAKGD